MRLEGEDARQAEVIHDAVCSTLDVDFPPGSLLVRWALVVDVMQPDGERFIARVVPDGTTWWEARGLYSAAASDLGKDTDE